MIYGKRDADHFILRDVPHSLSDYLRELKPVNNAQTEEHLRTCELIAKYPLLVGLPADVDTFRERPFVNHMNQTLGCPDIIAYDGNEFTVMEVGTNPRTTQLRTAYAIFRENFGIVPRMLRIIYEETRRGINLTVKSYTPAEEIYGGSIVPNSLLKLDEILTNQRYVKLA